MMKTGGWELLYLFKNQREFTRRMLENRTSLPKGRIQYCLRVMKHHKIIEHDKDDFEFVYRLTRKGNQLLFDIEKMVSQIQLTHNTDKILINEH